MIINRHDDLLEVTFAVAVGTDIVVSPVVNTFVNPAADSVGPSDLREVSVHLQDGHIVNMRGSQSSLEMIFLKVAESLIKDDVAHYKLTAEGQIDQVKLGEDNPII